MTTNPLPARHNQPTNDELHPVIYRSMIGLTIWLVLSVWFLFNRGPYVGLNLAIVTLFFIVFLGIPIMLWLAWRHAGDADETRSHAEPSFRDWSRHKFITWQGALTGKEAMTQILLPIAAVAIGMTIFGLVFYFAVPHPV
jgi:hypothetical protein